MNFDFILFLLFSCILPILTLVQKGDEKIYVTGHLACDAKSVLDAKFELVRKRRGKSFVLKKAKSEFDGTFYLKSYIEGHKKMDRYEVHVHHKCANKSNHVCQRKFKIKLKEKMAVRELRATISFPLRNIKMKSNQKKWGSLKCTKVKPEKYSIMTNEIPQY
uniref:Transthyretin-like family protein n=1 Tax=Strongyloides stercoralis TaxID=6248 RepID=A0A0K0E628_STRER